MNKREEIAKEIRTLKNEIRVLMSDFMYESDKDCGRELLHKIREKSTKVAELEVEQRELLHKSYRNLFKRVT